MSRWVSDILKALKEAWRGPRSGALLAALVIVLVLLPGWWFLGDWYRDQLISQRRSQAADEISLRGNALTAALNRRLSLLEGLHAYVQSELEEGGIVRRFDTFAAGLYESAEGIRNIALAPESVVQFVYPLEPNQGIIGYNPLKDTRSEVRQDAQEAIETGELTLTGPIELLQGGYGLIVRKAVYLHEDYWGLVNIVMDIDPILLRAGLDSQAAGEFEFILWDETGSIFYGSEDLMAFDPVVHRVPLQTEDWGLASAPVGGWEAVISDEMRIFRGGSLLTVLLAASLAYLLTNRQVRLARAVEQRTEEIKHINVQLELDIAEREKAEKALLERESQYRSVFESTSDGLLINDLNGELVDFNPAAAYMHGYTAKEFSPLQPQDFIHPDYMSFFQEYIESVKNGDQFRGQALHLRKDGSTFYVELFGTRFTYRGQPHALAVVRDVSEQVEVFQLLEERVQARTRELTTLLDVSHTLASTLELNPLLSLILDRLKEVVDYIWAGILILEDEELVLLDQQGAGFDSLPSQRFPVSQYPYAQKILTSKEAWIAPERDSDLELWDGERSSSAFESAHSLQVRAWMGVPLVVKESAIGILFLEHERSGYYTSEQAELAQAFAHQAAVAIENARLYEQAQSLAALQERQKLARDLHDSVSQALYGIGLGARTARTLVDRDPDGKGALVEPLEYVLTLAEAGLAEMRALIFELRPESLEREGLVAALTKQTAALRARHEIQVETEFCEEPPIPFPIKESIYRVAQEAMHNVVKHAQATRIEVLLECEDEQLALRVSDDGRGFDPQGSFPGHLGLRSMRERVERLHGKFEVHSAPGEGTIVRALMPLPPGGEK